MRTVVRGVLACLLGFSATPSFGAENPYSTMSLDELLNQEIVTSSRVKEKVSSSHSTVKVITAEEIRQLPVTTVAELLKLFVPGMDVRFEFDQRFQTYVGARGLTGDNYSKRILFLLDGRPLNSVIDGDFEVDTRFPLSAIRQIEVIRGPGSSLYGANAFLGIVNIITGTPEDKDGGSVTARYGTYGNYGASGVVKKEVLEGLNVFLSLETDGASENGTAREFYDLPETIKDYQEGFSTRDLKARAEYKGVTLSGGVSRSDMSENRKGDLVWDPSNPQSMTRDNEVNSQYASLRFERTFIEKLHVGANAYYATTERDTDYSLSLEPRGGSREADVWLFERAGAVDAQVSYTPIQPLRILAGGDFIRRSTASLYDRDYLDGRISRQGALFGEVNYEPFAFLDVVAGCRYDMHSEFHSQLSPRLSVLGRFAEGKGTARLSYASAFRAPTYIEMYLTKRTDPEAEVGPETINTFELSGSYQLPMVKITGTLFRSVLYSRIEIAGRPGAWFYRNTPGRQFAHGFELEADAVIAEHFRVFANYSLEDTKTDVEGDPFATNMPYAPLHKLQAGTIVVYPWFDVALSGYYVGTQRDAFFKYGNPVVEPYFGLFAKASVRPVEKLTVSLTVKNILDSEYFDKNGQMKDSRGRDTSAEGYLQRPNYYPPRTILLETRLDI